MRVYISGKITGTGDYQERFSRAEMKLKSRGYTVFNPCYLATLYPFLTYDEYLKIDLAVLDGMDAIYMLSGWESSQGANVELRKAKQLGINVMYEEKEKNVEAGNGTDTQGCD